MAKRTMQLSNSELREEIQETDQHMSEQQSSSSEANDSDEEIIQNIPLGAAKDLPDFDAFEYGEEDMMGDGESWNEPESSDADMK